MVTIAKQVEAEVPDVLLARYGGEEFVIAIPSCTLDDATIVAERIRAELEKTPMAGRYNSIAVTASFGISQVSHQDDTLEKLLKYADMALYQAKRAGRNQVIAFEEHVLAERGRELT
ncbi:Response regulator PleD [compost metagenome]